MSSANSAAAGHILRGKALEQSRVGDGSVELLYSTITKQDKDNAIYGFEKLTRCNRYDRSRFPRNSDAARLSTSSVVTSLKNRPSA